MTEKNETKTLDLSQDDVLEGFSALYFAYDLIYGEELAEAALARLVLRLNGMKNVKLSPPPFEDIKKRARVQNLMLFADLDSDKDKLTHITFFATFLSKSEQTILLKKLKMIEIDEVDMTWVEFGEKYCKS